MAPERANHNRQSIRAPKRHHISSSLSPIETCNQFLDWADAFLSERASQPTDQRRKPARRQRSV